ncbi:VOC family protein [Candidatus Microgenomates bacterium]|nr:VOC family protein [Candidatus Microgenomates bacterium]
MMALNYNNILISSQDPQALIAFYQKVANADPVWKSDDGSFVMFKIGSGWICIGSHDKVKGKNQGPERVMFGFETQDVKGEHERLKAAGAAEVAAPYNPPGNPEMWLSTLADPDGNYFQLGSPMKV